MLRTLLVLLIAAGARAAPDAGSDAQPPMEDAAAAKSCAGELAGLPLNEKQLARLLESAAKPGADRAYFERVISRQQTTVDGIRERHRACIAAFKARIVEEERQRILRAQAAAERQAAEEKERAEVDALLADRGAVRTMLSASACLNRQRRADALAEIKAQKKYSRIGGVVRLRQMAELQDQLRAADEQLARVAVIQQRRKTGALLPCSDRLVVTLAACADEPDLSACAADPVRRHLAAMEELE